MSTASFLHAGHATANEPGAAPGRVLIFDTRLRGRSALPL